MHSIITAYMSRELVSKANLLLRIYEPQMQGVQR